MRFLAITVLLASFGATAATITINTTGPQDARIAPAVGRALGLPGNANAAQVKAWLIQKIREEVEKYERDLDNAAQPGRLPAPVEPS